MNTRPPGPILSPGTRGPHSVLAPDVSPDICRSGQSIAGPGLCPKSRHRLPPVPQGREDRWGAGLAGVAWLVERQRKARARGKGCVHGQSRGVRGRAASV